MKTTGLHAFLAGAFLGAFSFGCDDDGTTGTPPPGPRPGPAGTDAGVDAPVVDGPRGGAGGVDGAGGSAGTGGSVDGRPADSGMLVANRPELRPFMPAMVNELRVPTGFRVQIFASQLGNPRMMATTPEGDVYVTVRAQSQVLRLRDMNGDGDASDTGEQVVAASMMDNPALEGVHGITFHMGRIYLATVKNILVATPAAGRLGSFQTLVSDLPDGGQHPNRTLGVGPDGKLYVTVGSTCNACVEPESEHATILRLELDGRPSANPANPAHPLLARNPMAMVSPRVWASGLRNTLGFDWHPTTGQMWGSDHGSDGLGDDVPPDEINLLEGGKSYGWPFCWGMRMIDPVIDEPSMMMTKQAYCPRTEPEDASYPAHSAPIGFLFYRGDQFPAEYRGDAFVALRGSWNRSIPTGYKILRVRFGASGPETDRTREDFLSGFLDSAGRTTSGRPAGLAVDATGALLLAEDTNGVIYRISYSAPPATDGGTRADAGARPDASSAD
jgi:glucose/arabinose dehydrogenase